MTQCAEIGGHGAVSPGNGKNQQNSQLVPVNRSSGHGQKLARLSEQEQFAQNKKATGERAHWEAFQNCFQTASTACGSRLDAH